MEHSAHELMSTGHKAIEEVITHKVATLLEEKYGNKLDAIAANIADAVGEHLDSFELK
jgi:hypothetical protein